MALVSTGVLRSWYAGYLCRYSVRTKVEVLGITVEVSAVAKDATKALDQALEATGYKRARYVWGYNCRQITGGTGYSLHAYGIALDIDPPWNPYFGYRKAFSWGDTLFTASQVAAVEAIRTKNGKKVWQWLGWASSIKDYMHWEICCTPSDLKTGINWSTVAGQASGEGEDVDVELKRSEQGPDIKYFRDCIDGWLRSIGGAVLPGSPLSETFDEFMEQQVMEYQKASSRPITGRIDWVTGVLLSRWHPLETERRQ